MTALQWAACVAFALAGLIQLRAAATTSRPRLRSAAMFFAFAVALGINIAPGYRAFDALTRVRNLADPVSHIAGVLGIYLFWTVLRSVLVEPVPARARLDRAVLSAVVVAEFILFCLIDAPAEQPEFTRHFGDQPATKAYWFVSATYGAACLTQLGVTVARSARSSSRRDVAIGLQVAAWGGIGFGAAYIVLKTIQISSVGVDPSLVTTTDRLQGYALGPGMLCLAGGLLFPLARRTTATRIDNLRIRRSLISLRPLIRRLHAAGALRGDVLLSVTRPLVGDVVGPVSHERLLRRVVESQDALLLIRTRLAEADNDPVEFAVANASAGLRVDYDTASRLDELARLPVRSTPAPAGPRRIDLFAEAQELVAFERAWRRTEGRDAA